MNNPYTAMIIKTRTDMANLSKSHAKTVKKTTLKYNVLCVK